MENTNGEIRYEIKKVESILDDSSMVTVLHACISGALAAGALAFAVISSVYYPSMLDNPAVLGFIIGFAPIETYLTMQRIVQLSGVKKVKKKIEGIKAQGVDTIDRESANEIEKKAKVNLFDALDIDYIKEEGGKKR